MFTDFLPVKGTRLSVFSTLHASVELGTPCRR